MTQQPERGETVTVKGLHEAKKTRRTWMIYVKPKARNGRTGEIDAPGLDASCSVS
jgi:hypothetical protein